MAENVSRGLDLGLDRWQLAGIVLCSLGIVDTVYLTWTKLAGATPYCGPDGGCGGVLESAYSEMFGIPISIFGMLAYLTLLVMFGFERRIAFLREWGPSLMFGMALFGVVVSGYLVWLQLGPLGQICPYCMFSAGTMALVFVVTVVRLRQAFSA